ncbi:MAG: YggS family pyridoxal phosphate-dependent enzyme [Paludibacteraceae bacterium]|nr:YggS family pyridoxal phosphate-dependent enzyme [Paludibacteraceae bacterium]
MIGENIKHIVETLPAGVRLVAVSKFNPNESIMEAYNAGQRLFGESHAQELVPKAEALPKDIKWHFIGHLQTNKVKYIAPYVSCIESVDSIRLLKEIDKQAAKCGRTIDCLLQFHVAQEETKFGFSMQECCEMLASEEYKLLQHINIVGVMGMASISDDPAQIASEFTQVKNNFNALKSEFFADNPSFCEISMGMTHDYPIAISCGATLIRVGSGIFGERMYIKH